MFLDTRATTAPSLAPHARGLAPEDLHLLERALRAWIEDPSGPDTLTIGRDDPVTVPLEHALAHLRRSTEPLTPAHRRALGLGRGATLATAAAELLQACVAADGPRCRSFRAARYFLAGLPRPDMDDGPRDGARAVGGPSLSGSLALVTVRRPRRA
jgi:hypothetical protein